MKTIAHLEITGASLESIVAALRDAVTTTDGWSTDQSRNDAYSKMHGARCFWMFLPSEIIGTPVGVAFGGEIIGVKREVWLGDSPKADGRREANRGKGRMRVANIVPSEVSQISTEQYNEAMAAVWQIVRIFSNSKKLRVHFKSGDWLLADVIPGASARKMFMHWLHGHPETFHPCDLQRLDFFIVALFRSKTKVVPEYVAQYLMEDRGWSKDDAALVCRRINAGLQVLAANRRYWRGA